MTKAAIKKLAMERGWELVDEQEKNFVLIFKKGSAKLNVWWTKMTIATTIDHPTKPRRQLFRKGITKIELIAIFDNPRFHTRKGYYTKYGRNNFVKISQKFSCHRKGNKHARVNNGHSGTDEKEQTASVNGEKDTSPQGCPVEDIFDVDDS